MPKVIEYLKLLENPERKKIDISDGWYQDVIDWDKEDKNWHYYENTLMGRRWKDTGRVTRKKYMGYIINNWLLTEKDFENLEDVVKTSPEELSRLLLKKAKERPFEIPSDFSDDFQANSLFFPNGL